MGTDGRELAYWASETDGAVALPIGYDSNGTSLGKPIPVTLTVMYDGATPLGYEAVRPNGWREQYTSAIPPVPTFALSALISPQGEAIRFLTASITVTNNGIPTELVRLDRVVASDGAETRLYYDNSSYPQTVTRVVGPQGQTTTLTYDDNQRRRQRGRSSLLTVEAVGDGLCPFGKGALPVGRVTFPQERVLPPGSQGEAGGSAGSRAWR